jgi:hypothetical protein
MVYLNPTYITSHLTRTTKAAVVLENTEQREFSFNIKNIKNQAT